MSRKAPARPVATAGNEHQLAIRVPHELLQAIDDEVERLRAERPGAKVQRSDAVREILYQALLADASFGEEAARKRHDRAEHRESTAGESSARRRRP